MLQQSTMRCFSASMAISLLLVSIMLWSPVLGFTVTTTCLQPRISSVTTTATSSPRLFALEFLADAEKEGVEKESWEKSWIPTSNGGFLPKLGRGKERKRQPNTVDEVTSMQGYKTQVADEKEKLVVVRFYAPWCRACKAIARSFRQLAQLYPDVKFVEVPLNKDTGMLHQGLGVPSLPYGHIYHPEAGLVEERRISRKHFSSFRDQILQSYVDGECPVQYNEDGTNSHASK